MIRVTGTITIGEEEIHEEFIRASGPGGQNVNKVATAVQLRFDVAHSPSLPENVRERLTRLAGKRLYSVTRDRLGTYGLALVAYLGRGLVGQGLKRLPSILVGSQ